MKNILLVMKANISFNFEKNRKAYSVEGILLAPRMTNFCTFTRLFLGHILTYSLVQNHSKRCQNHSAFGFSKRTTRGWWMVVFKREEFLLSGVIPKVFELDSCATAQIEAFKKFFPKRTYLLYLQFFKNKIWCLVW